MNKEVFKGAIWLADAARAREGENNREVQPSRSPPVTTVRNQFPESTLLNTFVFRHSMNSQRHDGFVLQTVILSVYEFLQNLKLVRKHCL